MMTQQQTYTAFVRGAVVAAEGVDLALDDRTYGRAVLLGKLLGRSAAGEQPEDQGERGDKTKGHGRQHMLPAPTV